MAVAKDSPAEDRLRKRTVQLKREECDDGFSDLAAGSHDGLFSTTVREETAADMIEAGVYPAAVMDAADPGTPARQPRNDSLQAGQYGRTLSSESQRSSTESDGAFTDAQEISLTPSHPFI